MKKLILVVMLMFSALSFAQLSESTYIYKNVTIMEVGKQTQDLRYPSQVTYFYNNEAKVRVEFAKESYIYTITSSPVRKTSNNIEYFEFNVEDPDGTPLTMYVFLNVSKFGCLISNGKISISYHNVDL